MERIVVVGHGMVGHRLLVELVAAGVLGDADTDARARVTVFGEEPRAAYDRVALSSFFDGATEDLCLVEPGFAESHGVEVVAGDAVVEIDRLARHVVTASGRAVEYDRLVLATGSSAFVPPVPGHDRDGCFVYRTIDDLERMREWCAQPHVRSGVVIGGGLLGLEAANALRLLGVEPHVVEMAPRLMPVQLDDASSAALRRHVEALGVHVHTGVRTTELAGAGTGESDPVAELRREDGEPIAADIVVFSAGIRPRDELARTCGLAVGERGGVLVDDTCTALDDPAVFAIGEVAAVDGRCYGLVAPGYDMARVVAARIADPSVDARFAGADLSTKLKLLGVDVASFGDAFGDESTDDVVWSDPASGVHRKLVVDRSTGAVRGGMLVGDADGYQSLRMIAAGEIDAPPSVSPLVLPAGMHSDGLGGVGADALPASATVCSCENVTAGELRDAVAAGAHTMGELKSCTAAGTGCGGCVPLASDVLAAELAKAGVEVDNSICAHFPHSRADLFALVRFHRHRSWAEVLDAHGTGRGCEICKPTVASILASLGNGYILDGDQAALQDTNDHALANMQRNGTYSVVPRVPGGEITPDQLIALGQIAKDFDLYTKITGGQRIDLFGARLEQLPTIWTRVVEAGMESGHAYGKSLRTVKSCVGETWCRYGVQDSTSMAIALELRYRGLRSPHKIKMAVSGCTRECAEAQSKDVGVIATEKGWNLYVAGNGGTRPRHADLLATDLDDEQLVTAIDRFLMYYVRTADKLQRTASWLESIEGGLEHVRAVVFDDHLGISAELDADMAHHVDTYECEWTATLGDPDRLSRFVSFVNAPDAADPEIVMVSERGQLRPIRDEERGTLVEIR